MHKVTRSAWGHPYPPPPLTTPNAHSLKLRSCPRTSKQPLANTDRAVDALATSATSADREGLWVDSKVYKAMDATNIAAGRGIKHPVLPPAASSSSKPADSPKSGSKYGPGDKFKAVRFTDKADKHHRGHRGQGGTTLPSYNLLHISCDCDDTDIDTMYRSCCITTGNSSSSLTITTLFDIGANPTSFVNRQVAAWIESQQRQ